MARRFGQTDIMTDQEITYVHGFSESLRHSAARLYDNAFGFKFVAAVRAKEHRISLLEKTFCPAFSFCAMQGEQLVGLAGYQTPLGSLTGGMNYGELLAHLGFFRGNWAALIFSLYERTPRRNELLMDGVAVDENLRGHGIGTRLLGMIADFAASEHFATIRLDVIDTNPRAQNLYERNGFVVTKTERFEYLRWLLGFGASSTMERRIPEATNNEVSQELA